MAEKKLSRFSIMGYGIGSLGTGVYSMTPSVLLLFFMTNTLGIDAWKAGLAISIPKLWDMITDPLMGMISDRTHTKWGRRRPYLLIGSIFMAISFVFLFSVPNLPTPDQRLLYIFVVFMISATSYTIFAVPYISMPPEMSDDPQERTRIMSYRFMFVALGLLVGSSFAPMLIEHYGGGREAYAEMSYIVGGFCAAMMMTSFFATKNLPVPAFQKPENNFIQELREGLRSKHLLILMLTYFLQFVGIFTFIALFMFYAQNVVGMGPGDAGLTFIFMMVSAMISMPLWTKLSNKIGKVRTYAYSMTLFCIVNLTFLIPFQGYSHNLYYLQIALWGLPFGSLLMIPFAMLTDVIQHDKITLGQNREGIFTGLWMAGEKTSAAVGPLMAGLALSAVGFIESESGFVQQSDKTILGIKLVFALLPTLLVALSFISLKYFKITEEQLGKMIEASNEKG